MFLYLTTTGRRTGRPREIEIWFTERDGRVYIIAEYPDRANWVRNIRADPHVHVRVGERRFEGMARVVDDDREPELGRDGQGAVGRKVRLERWKNRRNHTGTCVGDEIVAMVRASLV